MGLAEVAVEPSDPTLELERHHAAMLAMGRGITAGLVDPKAAFREFTECCARGLDVDRSSIWRFEGGAHRLCLLDLYEAPADAHQAGTTLDANDFPTYFREMWTGKAVDAHDAQTDPRTLEFTEVYLKPLGIVSMLDVSMKGPAGLVGVVCNEHRRPRLWKASEVRLAAFMASLATMVLALQGGD